MIPSPICLGVSDIVWQALIAGGVTVVLALISARAAADARKAAVAAKEVKDTLVVSDTNHGKKLDDIATDQKKIIEVQDGQTERLLRLYAVSARSKADITNATADITLALDAEKELAAHIKGMRVAADKTNAHGK